MKKTIFKKTSKLYRIIPLVIIFTIFISSIPSVAITNNTGNLKRVQLSSGKTVTLTQRQLNDIIDVSSDEAEIIAKEFIANMIKIGNVCWNENTEIISIVPMYDTNDSINAYAVNLSSGYIIVSAHMDAAFKIYEWSDVGEALYKSLNASKNDRIVYLGGYDYYIDSGNNELLGLNGEKVNADLTYDLIDDIRDINNIPEVFFEEAQASSRSSGGSYIDNTLTDSLKYGSNFVVNSYVDNWNGMMEYYEDTYPLSISYYNSCAPIAITNTIAAFKNKYPSYAPYVPENNNYIFETVANHGIANSYYSTHRVVNAQGTVIVEEGTSRGDMSTYIRESHNLYSIYPTVTDLTSGLGSYNRYVSELQNNNLIVIMLYNENSNANAIYGKHAVVCHGFIRYYSQTSSAYLSYVHLADGLNNGIRYLPMAWVMNSWSVIIDY